MRLILNRRKVDPFRICPLAETMETNMKCNCLIAAIAGMSIMGATTANAASRHHHEHQYLQEHRNAYVMGDIGIVRPFSTDRESFVMLLGN
jgi:hypothetical protein